MQEGLPPRLLDVQEARLMNIGPAEVGDPSDPRFQDPRLRPDVLEFLRTKAFPTWDFFDTAARRQLLRQYPSQEIGQAVAGDLRLLGPFLPHVIPPMLLGPMVQINVTTLRPPNRPRRRWFGSQERTDNSDEARDSQEQVFLVDLSALGPFAAVAWMWPRHPLEPPVDTPRIEASVPALLRARGLTVLMREEFQVPVRGMKGTPFGKSGLIPDVYACLFNERTWRMRALQVTALRFQGPVEDIWPTVSREHPGR